MTAPENHPSHEDVIALHKQPAARTPQEMIKRKIEEIDKAIDKLVSPAETLYELYRLTDVEIKIVEGK